MIAMTEKIEVDRKQIRTFLLYEYLGKCKAAEAVRNICSRMGGGTVSYDTTKIWFAKFKKDHFNLDEGEHSGRPVKLDESHLLELVGVTVNTMSQRNELAFDKVIVHPVVMLGIADHYDRIRRTQSFRRVVGVLLGYVNSEKALDIVNSFAVPFDEELREKTLFFLDEDYMERMSDMFNKVSAKERIVGWYHTGPNLFANDTRIHKIMQKHRANPILLIADMRSRAEQSRCTTYKVNVKSDTPFFEHITCEVAGEEAEEVGVEHLLRHIKHQLVDVGTLSERISDQCAALNGLVQNLGIVQRYLNFVCLQDLPPNHELLGKIQDIFNLIATATAAAGCNDAQIRATNDHLVAVYLGSLIRTILVFHDLVENKLSVAKEEEETSINSSKAPTAGKPPKAAAK